MSMNKNTYLKLQLKRTAKIYPIILFITILTVVIVGITAAILLAGDSENKTRIKIGLVGETEDSYLNIGLTALENLDSSKYSIEFVKQTEEEAKKELAAHNISGYIYVPKNFVKDIFYGRNTPATYVMSDKLTSFESIMISEIAMCISDLVVNSQNSIYGMQLLAFDYDKTLDLDKKIDIMNLSYIEKIITREKMFEVSELGVADSVTMGGYYICGIIMFFLLIWGISCNKLFIRNDLAMAKVLYSRGLNNFWQVTFEYISFFVVTFLTFLMFSVIFGFIIEGNDFGVLELKNAGVFKSLGFIFKIIPVILMITAMEMMLYEIAEGTLNSVILQFIVAVTLAYISGCFYPNTFFPESVQNISGILPSGVGFSYMRKCMSESSITSELVWSFVYFTLFFSTTVLVRKYKTEGDRQ